MNPYEAPATEIPERRYRRWLILSLEVGAMICIARFAYLWGAGGDRSEMAAFGGLAVLLWTTSVAVWCRDQWYVSGRLPRDQRNYQRASVIFVSLFSVGFLVAIVWIPLRT